MAGLTRATLHLCYRQTDRTGQETVHQNGHDNHADGGFSVWDPARNYWRKKGNLDVQDRRPGYVFSPKEVWDGLQIEEDNRKIYLCNGLVLDWAAWIREGGTNAENIAAVLELLAPQGEILEVGELTRISVDDNRDMPTLRTAYAKDGVPVLYACLLYTSPSPRDGLLSRMPSSA